MSSEIFSSYPLCNLEEIPTNPPDLEAMDIYILQSPLVQGVIQLIHRILG